MRVHLIETGGGADNLRALIAGDEPQVGFVEAGTEVALDLGERVDGVTSLGTIYLEPLWLFVRAELPVQRLEDLRGLRVDLGLEGGDSFASLTRQGAAAAMNDGEVDALFAIGAPESEVLESLLHSDVWKPVSIRRSAAYERRLAYLAAVTLPEGTINLGLNIPDADLQQLAASVNLVTDDDTPPALVDLLLEAAGVIHGGRTLYTDHGAFPTPNYVSLPLNEAAANYYRNGPSPLRRVLPFWLATAVNRFLGFAAAVGGTALAVFGLLPGLLGVRFQISANGYWRRLEKLEKERAAGEDKEVVLARLDEVLRDSADLRVPLNLKPDYFELRQEMHDMRDRLTG